MLYGDLKFGISATIYISCSLLMLSYQEFFSKSDKTGVKTGK